jgi:5S rRNA maturation endonuclease (ribonuclease M5)
MTPEEIIAHLDQRDLAPRPSGPGRWQARCPAHDDRTPSLAVSQGSDDRTLLHCHAGCSVEDILAALTLTATDLFAANGNGNGQPGEEYIYVNAVGTPVMKAVRKPGKKFAQAQPDGTGGWIWNVKGVERVLYRLPKVLAAVEVGATIYVCEGEKDVHALERAGVTATTNPGGAGKWREEYSRTLAGANVVVIADRDEPGMKHARDVATSLTEQKCTVRIVRAGEAMGKDAHDHLAAGGSVEDFVPITEDPPASGPTRDPSKLTDLFVEQILRGNPGLDEEDVLNASEAELKKMLGTRKSAASEVVKMVEEAGVELFHDPEGMAFATFEVDGHSETWRVGSRGFKGWARKLYFEQTDGAPNGQAITDALALLEAKAMFDGPEIEVHLRVASVDGAIYLDLGDQAWRSLAITRDGWFVTDQAPVRFRRTRGMLALPEPQKGGDLDLLRPFLNLGSDDASEDRWRLFVAWLLASLRPGVPCPILIFGGEQGSAKSTQTRIARLLTDPSTVPLRSSPSKVDDLMVGATSSWVLALDNLSNVQPWLSDALCRLSTGGGLSKRELYSDAEEVLLDAQRPVILNGIGEIANRSDLLDRAIVIELPVLDEAQYQAERDFWTAFDAVHPKILGGLLDALVGALANVDQVRLDRLPRMADFATWITAAEVALGWEPGAFMDSYTGNRNESHEIAIESSPIGVPLRTVADDGWEGTFTELLGKMNEAVEEKLRPKDWPKSARGLSSDIQRIAPNLRRVGYTVEVKDHASRRRTITLGRSL